MVRLSLATSGDVHLTLSSDVEVVDHVLPDYTGATDVIPRTWVQTLPTKNTSVRSDITVREIPSNYGLITWDGSVLTVS